MTPDNAAYLRYFNTIYIYMIKSGLNKNPKDIDSLTLLDENIEKIILSEREDIRDELRDGVKLCRAYEEEKRVRLKSGKVRKM